MPSIRPALLLTLLALTQPLPAGAQEVLKLWKDGPPGFAHLKDQPEKAADWWVRSVHHPSLTVYRPAPGQAKGTAVIIAPGGGHQDLVIHAEGTDAATFLSRLGVTAFVLKYRLAREPGSPYQLGVHAREDALRAVRTVRARAGEFGIDPKRVGMIGFSAGGEVVAWVAYGGAGADGSARDAIDRLDGKPDFQVLVYPGPLGIPAALPKDAPPAFMVAAMDDECCVRPVLELARQYQALKLPAELHLYAGGGHGFNMGQRTKLVSVKHWPQRLAEWLEDSGYLRPAQ